MRLFLLSIACHRCLSGDLAVVNPRRLLREASRRGADTELLVHDVVVDGLKRAFRLYTVSVPPA